METSRSEDGGDAADEVAAETDGRVQIEPDATPAEAAAVAVAIARYLESESSSADRESPASWWRKHAWRLHARFRDRRGVTGRPTADLPRDPWRAGDRSRRL